MTYTPVIGLEIHVELKTASKMFCGCPADWFGRDPNTVCCPVCLGLPGALPVPNRKAVEWCVMLGQALGCTIPLHAKFDRKNYFYPDLPKGYQISQYDQPFARDGYLKINIPDKETNEEIEKTIRIRRVHLEEDTGKLLHTTLEHRPVTLVDFNRSGVPLVEIVTEPDLQSPEEARIFLKKLHQLIRYIGISDADMEKGSMRLEPNISLKGENERELPAYKVEVKNINSFSFAKKAIEYELTRHEEILLSGQVPKQETRGWDEKKQKTVSQRSKEEAADYRYFPEPDIPPIVWEREELVKISSQICELPDLKKTRYVTNYGLNSYDSSVLVDEKSMAEFFESCVALRDASYPDIPIKSIANWIINKKQSYMDSSPGDLLRKIVEESTKVYLTDEEVAPFIKLVIEKNPKAVEDVKLGKESPIMFLVGAVMRETKGKANPSVVKELLKSLLGQ